MEQISRRIIFNTLPDTRRAKPLTDEVLGLTYKEQLNGGFIGKSLTGICLRKTGASLDG